MVTSSVMAVYPPACLALYQMDQLLLVSAAMLYGVLRFLCPEPGFAACPPRQKGARGVRKTKNLLIVS